MLINIPFYYSENINDSVARYTSSILQRIVYFYYHNQLSDLSHNKKKVNYLVVENEELFNEDALQSRKIRDQNAIITQQTYELERDIDKLKKDMGRLGNDKNVMTGQMQQYKKDIDKMNKKLDGFRKSRDTWKDIAKNNIDEEVQKLQKKLDAVNGEKAKKADYRSDVTWAQGQVDRKDRQSKATKDEYRNDIKWAQSQSDREDSINRQKDNDIRHSANDITNVMSTVGNNVRSIGVSAGHAGSSIADELSNTLSNTGKTILNVGSSVSQQLSRPQIRGMNSNSAVDMRIRETMMTHDEPTWFKFNYTETKGNISDNKNVFVGIKAMPIKFGFDNIIFTFQSDIKNLLFSKIKGSMRSISAKIFNRFGSKSTLSPLSKSADVGVFLNNQLSAVFYSTLDFNDFNIDDIDNYEILAHLRNLGWKILIFDDPMTGSIHFLIPYGRVYFYKQTISYSNLSKFFKNDNKTASKKIYESLVDVKKDLGRLFNTVV